ncbi:hypothetical protein ABT247_00450 [Kitasatospora sp. NPDC001539]|uniref:hypothetical protein n=1 Tax=Kitasatospora sp. NPDC001539 TaxID=3154384 RepID=UPI003331A9CC
MLQQVTDEVGDAVVRRLPSAAAPAQRLVSDLRARGWAGDDELAARPAFLQGLGPDPATGPSAARPG